MLVLVTGSRSWTNRAIVRKILEEQPEGFELMHGGAPGLDTIAGEEYKALTGNDPIVVRPDYKRYYFKIAPKMRNVEMVNRALERYKDGEEVRVIGFRDWESKTNGTKHCINEAKIRGLPTEEINSRLSQGD